MPEFVIRGPEAMAEFGTRVGAGLRAGDLVLLGGDLGAGKTTLMRGLGAGMGVRGPITSPTFVLARRHPSECGGPALVHVDAYRLSGAEELTDLDLESDLSDAVVAVEWGVGLADGLSESRLEITIAGYGVERTVDVRGVGPAWAGRELPR